MSRPGKNSKLHHPPEFANPDAYVRGAQGRRSSNAAGPHADKRTKRTRDRGRATRSAIAQSRRDNQ